MKVGYIEVVVKPNTNKWYQSSNKQKEWKEVAILSKYQGPRDVCPIYLYSDGEKIVESVNVWEAI